MRRSILLSSIIFLFHLSFSQEINDYHGNFRIQEYLAEHGKSTDLIGFFVKGNKEQIINLCFKHNGKYRGSVKGWHYVKTPTNEFTGFINCVMNKY